MRFQPPPDSMFSLKRCYSAFMKVQMMMSILNSVTQNKLISKNIEVHLGIPMTAVSSISISTRHYKKFRRKTSSSFCNSKTDEIQKHARIRSEATTMLRERIVNISHATKSKKFPHV